ncbi:MULTISPECIES: AAA family ATPase [unclassified Cetobacterium]|uniref:AAA family ATPase n=1 Tax=unclassified Cetobacterium TaxID=2630983 RepID=UPI0006490A9B|nr:MULTISPECIES: AAA family ATPase [unclassified Cetobacterium]
MIFKSIILENFRPYYGKVKLEFCNGEKNITLLKAENGSGKTTLLQAIRWGLYGGNLDLTSGDPKKFGASSFINKKYLEETKGKTYAKVELNIVGKVSEEKEEQEYKIIRQINFENDVYIGVDLILESNAGKINQRSEAGCQEIINRLLPKEINFFIDGERLEKIAPEKENQRKVKKESLEAIEESINRVLGIKSLENAVTDTAKVYRDLEKEYSESSSANKDIVELEQKVKKIEKEFEDKLQEKEEKQKETELLDIEKEELSNRIDEILLISQEDEKNKKVVEMLQDEKKELEKSLEAIQKKYKEFLSIKGVEAIAPKILNNAFKVIEIKKDKGEIPSRYEKEFLEELIHLKECICGASLVSHTDNYRKIMQKLENAATRENREKVSEVYFMLRDIASEDISENVKLIKLEISKIQHRIDYIEQELEVLVKDSNYDFQVELQNIKNILISKEEIKKTLHKSIGALEVELERIEKELISIRIEKTEADKKNIKSKREREKRDFAKKIMLNLETLKKYKEAQGREGLKSKIEEVYSKINKKGYKVELTEEFDFKVFDIDGKEAGMSKGEAKNKALSFIGGLVYYAKELNKEKNKSDLDSDGGIYPLVLDAPYGDLDNEYRLDFTKMLPVLSEQIIVMVSSGQWNSKIEDVVKDRIGKVYTLENERRTGIDKRYDITRIKEEI